MRTSISLRATNILLYWLQIWLYILGIAVFIVTLLSSKYDLATHSTLLFITGLLVYVLKRILETKQTTTDNYAASIHSNSIQHFFNKQSALSKTTIPEFVERTTFKRKDNTGWISRFCYVFTFALIFILTGIIGHLTTLYVTYTMASILLFVYSTDMLVSLRNQIYLKLFTTTIETPDSASHIKQIIEILSTNINCTPPEVKIVTDNPIPIGFVNSKLTGPKIIISDNLLEKDEHLQTGLIAHELGHLYTNTSLYVLSEHLRFLIPILLIVFANVTFSLTSTLIFAISILISMALVSIRQQQEELAADAIAAKLVQAEFVILAILEMKGYNPFVDTNSKLTRLLNTVSNSHPPALKRIRKLTESRQSFNSDEI